MGLTIGYKLSARRPLKLADVRELIEPMRAVAHRLGFEEVGELIRVGPDYLGQYEPPRGNKNCKFSDMLPPAEGWVFSAVPGDGSESVQIGLCRHQGWPGWRWRGYCKTQYATRHGWEHFRDCHRRVVELLRACEQVDGLKVKASDEGGYWGTRSEWTLFRRISEYDRQMAGMVGALKDVLGGAKVIAPITDNPRFERLEHEGQREHGTRMTQAAEVIRRLRN